MPKGKKSPEDVKTATDGRWMTLVPAYGRDYKTADEVLKDWIGQKDFLVQDISWPGNGRYVNRQDAENPEYSLSHVTFKVRYGTILNTGFRLPNFCLIRLEGAEWKVIGVSDGT